MWVYVVKVQWRPSKINLGSADRWWNLDLSIWPGNQDAVSGLAVSGQVYSPKTKKIMPHTKKIVACFLGKLGHVATISLEDRRTVTSDWYMHHCFPRIFEVWCQCHPKTGLHGIFFSWWQCQCAHSSNNTWLSQWEWNAVAAAPTLFARPLSLQLPPIFRSA